MEFMAASGSGPANRSVRWETWSAALLARLLCMGLV
jgi:hypothetical protein